MLIQSNMLLLFLLPVVFSPAILAAPSKNSRVEPHLEFPHLLIHVDKRQPNTVIGNQKSGDVEHSVHTHVNFDVPSWSDATVCRIGFHIDKDPVKNAPRHLWGVPPYRFNVSSTAPALDKDLTTWNNAPIPLSWVAQIEVDQAGIVNVASIPIPCLKGQAQQFVLYPDNPARDFGFTWYELDYPHGITFEMGNV